MRFFPRSGQFLLRTVFLLLFCGLCISPGMALGGNPEQQTSGTDSSPPQQDGRPASAVTRPPGVAQAKPFGQVESTIEVRADDLANQISPVRQGVRQDIQSSAGTFG